MSDPAMMNKQLKEDEPPIDELIIDIPEKEDNALIAATNPNTSSLRNALSRPQSYLNILYLLISFPLGIFYFVFLILGFSLGIGLAITLLGIPILLGTILGAYGLAAVERQMAIHMLKIDVPPMNVEKSPPGIWPKLQSFLRNSVTWKSIGYLLAKFPLGIASFVTTVTLIATSMSLVAAPFIYRIPGVEITIGFWQIDTFLEALLACVAGIGLGYVSIYILNGLAWLSGQLARLMLGHQSDERPFDDNHPKLLTN